MSRNKRKIKYKIIIQSQRYSPPHVAVVVVIITLVLVVVLLDVPPVDVVAVVTDIEEVTE